MGLEEFAQEASCVFAEFAVIEAEGGVEVGVDVEFADYFFVYEDGDYDFGFSFEGAGQIAGIGIDVVDDDSFACGGGGAADALMEGDARVGRHGSFEGAEDEDVMIAFFFEHVKANPIVTSEFFVKKGDYAFHERIGVAGRNGEAIESRDEVGRFCMCGGHEA